ncbi:hypothetical protein QBC34DRAFT_478584 [Podospora aff. communis PSN243]|uniref:Heterokaryon incompatibility domain-containing protein n=1 Tax=Podospora aff. communis PSN243 TaxID=3040156 RepID=A0AAV9G6Q4_9PEZI|nr:hypothetical protein QBC34DRAFT_478584 [Podospora aff. communis PSN243]
MKARGLNIAGLLAEVGVRTTDGKVEHRTAVFHAAADEGDPATTSGDIISQYLGENHASWSHQTAIGKIRSWVKECSEHYDCSHTLFSCEKLDSEKSPLPSRCIHVGRAEDGSLELKLQITSGKIGRYMTLSHRWTSETERVSTTTANMADKLRGVGFHNLPRSLAADLDIAYVWIDSLCIIQGDLGDWTVEAVKMANYYQRSAEVGKRYESTVVRSELLTRAWVFQEWVLSRRIICFTSGGPFFLCQSRSCKQHATNYSLKNRLIDNQSTPWHQRLVKMQLDDDDHANWESLVHGYSELHLSCPSKDRLVAINGIADEFARAMRKRRGQQMEAAPNGPSMGSLETRTMDLTVGLNGEGDGERGAIFALNGTYVAGLWLPRISRGLVGTSSSRNT